MTKGELSALTRKVGLGHTEDKLMQAALPSLRLHHWQGEGHFYVSTQALAQRNFDSIWVEVQCS